ncbi:MAG TPA: sigma-E factor regulatory protein RseB domain-containing protein [Vicinamibacterales bacterium]|jgi:hypothetical protein|nr:sigma-E factor regulatory protein RseB domain-containing protein [Vicinamibacterales bacterium]
MISRAAWCAALAVVVLTPAIGRAADRPLHGLAIDVRLSDDILPADVSRALPVIVRIGLDRPAVGGSGGDTSLERLGVVLDAYDVRKLKVVVALGALPADDADVETWRERLRAIATRGRGKVAAYQVGEVTAGAPPDAERYAYLLKLAAVQLRSVDASALVLQGAVPAGEAAWESRQFAAAVGPYVDGVAIAAPPGAGDAMFAAAGPIAALVEREKPSASILLGPVELSDAAGAAARLVDAALRAPGTPVGVVAFAGPLAAVRAAFSSVAGVGDLIAGDLVALDEKQPGLAIHAGAARADVPHRLLYNVSGFETFLVYWSERGGPPIDVDLTVANAATPMVRDPVTGRTAPPLRVRSEPGNRLHVTLPAEGRPMIVEFNYGSSGTYGASVDVQQQTLPRVEEIIFRHQQAQAAQDAVLNHYVAHVRIEQHFHPSPADPAYNLITENRLFSDREGVEWEELSFELNGAKWTANRPAFPLVQPEKVLSLPLDLRLNQDYAYRLEGVDQVAGRPAFVVRFDPVDSAHALYRGTVWIDRQTFLRLKVQAVETKLSGTVVSNDETQLYAPAGEAGGRTVWLMDRVTSKQIFLIAGRSVLVEREVRLTDFGLNGPDFERERSVARASDRVMYRDTDQGVRYFVKKGESRVVSNQLTTSARAFALGADIDPSLDYPLPIGGIDILDFNFLDRNMQLALLYGGVIALGNIQHPDLWGGRFDASVDFFGLAVKSSDDVFDAAGKRSAERVNRIPLSAGVNIGYQATPYHKVTGHFEFGYAAYFRDASTAPDFVLPSNTVTTGEGAGYEFRRGGYSVLADAAFYRRATWNAWGTGTGFDAADRSYVKYDAGLSKDFTFRTFHTIHLNGTYFGGQRLDRFSMYEFGLFDAARMHGVPSAVRFADVGMFRGSYSFNVFEQYRVDLFLEHARGREADSGDWRPVTGTGIRLNLRAPRSTILQVDVGKSFLPGIYRGIGSTVVQILLLKPL